MASNDETAGVIHDIGFRHYDGPRLGRGWIVRSLAVETLRGVFGLGRPSKEKVTPWILIGILLAPPIIFVLIITILHTPDLPISYTAYPTSMQLIVSLFVAGRAPYAVARDLREGVLPLYLSRPMKRDDYVWAKFAGLALGIFLALAAPETLLLVGALLAKLPVGAQILGWLGGLVAVAILALVLASIGLLIASLTPRRGIGTAAIISTMLLLSALAHILFAVVDGKGNHGLATYLLGIDPYGLVDGIAVSWFGVASAAEGPSAGAPQGWLVFTLAAVALVAACLALVRRRYRKVGRA